MVQAPDHSSRGDEPDSRPATHVEHISGEPDSRQGTPGSLTTADESHADTTWREAPHLELIKTIILCVAADVALIGGEVAVERLKSIIDHPNLIIRACLAMTQLSLLVAFSIPLVYLIGIFVRVAVKPTGNYLHTSLRRITPKLVVKHAAAAGLGAAVVFGAALALAVVLAAWPWVAALGLAMVGGLLYLIHKFEVEQAPRLTAVVVILTGTLYGLASGAARLVDALYPVR